MWVYVSFIAGKVAGEILASAVVGARWMMLYPNDLITIAAKNEEGNVSGGASWRLNEEDAPR